MSAIPALKAGEEMEAESFVWNPDYEGPVFLTLMVEAEDKKPIEYSDEKYVYGTEKWSTLLTVVSRESLLIIKELTELKELVVKKKRSEDD